MRYLLWSGGWDSTYLLCKWARESDEAIQPIYVVRPECSNVYLERQARRTMLPLIQKAKDIKAKIMEPIELAKEGLPDDPKLDAAYEKYKGKIMMLYSFVGKAAILYPQLAIAAEAPAPGTKAMSRTKEQILAGHLSIDKDGKITPNVGDADALAIFSGLQFPLLDVDKSQMMDDVKQWGYMDIFKHTWGCYRPGTEYCGVCGVCELELAYGDTFKWRFSDKALKDHKIKEYLEGKGSAYAEYFKKYVMNNNWLTVMNEDGTENKEKSENLLRYFSYLENHWPEADINAPAL